MRRAQCVYLCLHLDHLFLHLGDFDCDLPECRKHSLI